MPPCGSLVDFVTVVDGDTLRLNGDLVRLVGIDAPEPGECGAPEARARLQKLIQASGFESGEALVAAPLRSRRGADFPDLDIYGRPLRELKYISERPAEGDELVPQPEVVWVGLELAREGHARWVDYSTANDMNRRDYLRATREYRQAADAAKAAGRGGWGTCGWK